MRTGRANGRGGEGGERLGCWLKPAAFIPLFSSCLLIYLLSLVSNFPPRSVGGQGEDNQGSCSRLQTATLAEDLGELLRKGGGHSALSQASPWQSTSIPHNTAVRQRGARAGQGGVKCSGHSNALWKGPSSGSSEASGAATATRDWALPPLP